MIDLESRVPMLYHCKSKDHHSFVEMIKKHALPGCIIYSDTHSSYVNTNSCTSKLARYGFYHFWINHSCKYVHEKFGFVHTTPIECCWNNLKKTACGLRSAMASKAITQHLNSYSFRCIFRKDGLHHMILKSIRYAYERQYRKYLQLNDFEEACLPNFIEIENIIEDL
jgi:hypothetical protein